VGTRKDWKKVSGSDAEIAEFNYFTVLEEDGFIEYNGEKFPMSKGKFRNTTRFEKYPSGIWKISLL
jgi:hypothetical protein